MINSIVRNGQRNPRRIFADDRDAPVRSAQKNNLQRAEHEESEIHPRIFPKIVPVNTVFRRTTPRTRVFTGGASFGEQGGERSEGGFDGKEEKRAEILAEADACAE